MTVGQLADRNEELQQELDEAVERNGGYIEASLAEIAERDATITALETKVRGLVAMLKYR